MVEARCHVGRGGRPRVHAAPCTLETDVDGMGVVAAQGSGTGLSLVASIAELHQARIDTDTGIDSAGLPYVCCFQWPETGHGGCDRTEGW